MKVKKIFIIILFAIIFAILGVTNNVTANSEKYVGNINTELKQFNLGKSGNASYISGEMVVVEWVDGKSTVPKVAPKMSFKSTDNTQNAEVFVTATGTNTYYFDRFIEGIDTSKEYYFEVESGDSNNISANRKMKVYFFNTKYNNAVIGNYHEKQIKLEGQKIKFIDRTDTYIGNINSELKTFKLDNNGIKSYVSGEIVVVEWVNGKSTVPEEKPVMKFRSTDGEVELEVFVTATGTNTYYFDRFIEGIDTSKEYYFEIASGNKLNTSPNKSMNVYFTKTKYNDTVIGTYYTFNVRLLKQKIIFEDSKYVGDINSNLIKIGTTQSAVFDYITGEIVIVEWVNGQSTVAKVTPKMKFKSTDGTIKLEVFVTPTGTNTYYFDRIIEGIPTDKEYYLEVESADERNVSPNKIAKVYLKNDFANKIIGNYGIEKMVVTENNKIIFKPLDETYPIFMNDDEKETFDLINQERIKNGLQPLEIDSRVQLLARTKAQDMIDQDYFSHYSPIYGWVNDMLNKASIRWKACGENIAGFNSNPAAVNGWMNSEGHRANILNSNYTHTGIGVVNGSIYGKIYAQIFITK